ncbi:MAG TPA: cbb3-type cytochrome c oxidase subunit I [Thermoanaerobaculia bacterium]|nr:cbb3-type cytochrome c oxidase subunit I [Thermoanaerobaculia bacterium]
MPLQRQVRVGTQWMRARDAQRALEEAIRVAEEEEVHSSAHRPSFLRKYVFSIDHKWIGIQYGFTALCFLLFGFSLMLLMRLQLAAPGHAFSIMKLLGEGRAPGGVMLPESYNQLGAMHGTIMVFLAIVPLAVGAFGNYLVPLMIGAPDMAFPKLNMMSYWLYLPGGLVMLASFAAPGGAPNSGWTSYPPLSVIATHGQDFWLVGMTLLITSSLLGSVNFIVTIVQLRAKGLTWMRLPFFVWAQLVTSFLLLLAFPPLEAAAFMQLLDRVGGTSFFLPSGLVVSGTPLGNAGGGNPLLWQHLFWFLAHPEVYVLILPAMGIISEIIANNTRKPLWGYKSLVGAVVFLGFMSFVVWAHHMFLTGMGTSISAFFQTTTMIISIPSVIVLTALIISLWGGSIRFNVPMMFALAFLPMFGIGGLTGLPLGLAAADIHLHDTYYVIGHFHYVVAPGTIFAMFAGIYFWFPKITGRQLNEKLGKLHFWGSIIFINGVFFPMFIQGLAGMSRRLYDGGAQYQHNQYVIKTLNTHMFIAVSAWLLLAAQVPFIINFFWSIAKGRRTVSNPWQATTLEWAATTSPPLAHGNFAVIPVVYRGPYEYSSPDYLEADFWPQNSPGHEPLTTTPNTGGGMIGAAAVAQKES